MSAPRASVAVILVDVDHHPIASAVLKGALVSARLVGGEVVVVDARTTRGRAWAAEPSVVVVGASPGASETCLRRRGFDATGAPVVAFLDAHAVPEPRWLETALRNFEDTQVAAVSASALDVGEPTMSLAGNVGVAHPLDGRSVHPVLYPIPEGAIIRSSVIASIGLDERLTWSVAVIELGWRVRLLGLEIMLDPSVCITSHCTCTNDDFGGLVVLYTCLGDDLLEAVFPAAMTTVTAEAVERIVTEAATLAAQRELVQATRVVGDEVITDLFLAPLEPPRWQRERAGVVADAAKRHGLELLLATRRRVLIVTPDIFTARMAGPAIRAWQIAEALATRHDVQLVSTAATCELASPRFVVSVPPEHTLRALADRADIIIFQGFAMEGRPYLARDDKVVIVDLYDPLHLEQLELFRDSPPAHRRLTLFGAVRVLNEQLARGDFFVCASSKQRDFWLGQLSALGRLNPATYDADNRLRRLLDVVPFGLPDEPPVATGHGIRGVVPGIGLDDVVIVWGGGIYNWFDPLTLIRAVHRLKERWPKVRLFFMGLRHPNPEVTEMRIATEARRLSKELGLTNTHVFFNEGWVPYGERQNYLLDADIGVSTHFVHVETEFSFRTRVLDYIWAGLPIVATEGDGFAHLIASRGLGIVVPEQDVEALEEALHLLLSDPARAAECRLALEELRGEFAWSRVLEPITSFCRSPRHAPDRGDPEIRRALWLPEAATFARWTSELPSLRQRLRRSFALR